MGLSTAAAILSLDAAWGDDHAPAWPDAPMLRLYLGDPRAGGVELDDVDFPGYLALEVDNTSTNFPPTSGDGMKLTPEFVMFTATDAWADVPTHAALCDGTTVLEVVARDTAAAAIPTAGSGITVSLALFYDGVTD